ncbi:MAG: hypothetical protein U9Q37_09415 [Euryarchaeota archaeon]|nr:hypothetical protein [Euryarchaeota archaeon]
MKGKNMILLSVAVLAIGLFVLPQTMAMFAGQHTWFSVRTSESQYELCEKCHVNEVAEWRANTGAHATYNADHPGCFCHQINESALQEFGLTRAMARGAYGKNFEHWNSTGNVTGSGTDWYWRSNNTPHAAVIIDCVDCHYTEMEQISDTNSAHYAFWNQTKNAENTDNNTACMACHTHTHLNITWIRLSGINIVANHTNATAPPYDAWDIDVTINETLDYNTTTTN